MIRTSGVEAYEGSVRYVRAVRDAGLRRAVVSSSANCHDVLVAAGIEDLFEARIDGVVAAREHLSGKPAPDTFLAGAKALGLEPRGGGGVRGCAGWRGGRPGRRVRLCRGSGPGGAGGGAEGPRRGHRRDRSRRVAGPSVIRQSAFAVEPWCLRETTLDPDMLAQTESVFALSNGHIGWRGNLDEGEPHGLPGTYLNGVFALRPLPYAEAGYGLPGVRADRHQRDERQADPAVRRRRALRYPLRRTARARARAGLPQWACWSAAPNGYRRPGSRVRVSSTRLVSLTQRAIAAISYEVEPLDGPARISVQSELLANEQLPARGGDPRVSAVLENPLTLRVSRRPRHVRRAGAHDGTERAAGRRGDGSPDRRLARDRRGGGVAGVQGRWRGHRDGGPAAGPESCA